MSIFKKLFYNEVPDIEPIVEKHEPLMTQQQPAVAQTPIPNPFIQQTIISPISPEDQEKWKNYFEGILSKIKETNHEYGQFLANIDMLTEADSSTSIVNKFKFAFGFLKNTGLTKEQLLIAANKAYETIQNDKKAVFEPSQAKKIQDGINFNNKLIQDKQAIILANIEANKKLNEEIIQHQSDIETNKQKISTREICYNTLFNQLLTKVSEDIKGIQSYIS